MPKSTATYPTTAANAIATGWFRVAPALIITLGDGTVLKYSTINITVGADTFTDRLKSVGPLKQSMTAAPDNVGFDLWNADGVAGLALVDPVNALNGAKAIYYRIVGNQGGQYALVEELFGFIEIDTGGGAGDEVASFTLISDAGLPTPVIATTQILTTCPYFYKGEFCTYSGAKATCDKSFDGVNGCTSHFGYEGARDRFGGHLRDLDPITIQAYSTPTQGGGGTTPAVTGGVADMTAEQKAALYIEKSANQTLVSQIGNNQIVSGQSSGYINGKFYNYVMVSNGWVSFYNTPGGTSPYAPGGNPYSTYVGGQAI